MAVEFSLGNIVVTPTSEVTLTHTNDEDAEKVGKLLWGNLFKNVSKLDVSVFSSKGKYDKINDSPAKKQEEPYSKQTVSYIKEMKMTTSGNTTTCRNCPHTNEIGVHVKRGDNVRLEVIFNKPWQHFDILEIQLKNSDIDEECAFSVDLSKNERQYDDNAKWSCEMVAKNEKKIQFEITVPISAMPGDWHLFLKFSSTQSAAVLHSFVLSGIQIV